MVNERTAALVQQKLKVLNLDALVEQYLTTVGACVLEEGGRARHLKNALAPILADTIEDEEKIAAVCQDIYVTHSPEGEEEGEEKDFLVDCRGIILAYAGKQLLKPTNLQLLRNHRYAVVGNNGVGKTTLLNRVASKEVANFPQDIKVLYIQHEVYVDLDCTVNDFMEQQTRESGTNAKLINDALASIGFTEERMASPVSELSGGWRMKLAIATAVTQKCDLLLLDEPTNHLDAASRNWLAEYLVTLTSTTVCIVSHDYEFLGKTCEDVLHKALPTLTESGATAVINFPDPGRLDGVKSRSKPILELRDLTFYYPGQDKPTFTSVFGKFTVMSHVALLGPNGAGKTTLLRQIVGDMATDQGTGKHTGEIIKHHNLRIAYIAQHSMHHLEENMRRSPVQYVQDRFVTGLDKELSKRETMKLSPEEEALCSKNGNISKVIGPPLRGGELCYETERWGREREGSFWEPLGSVKCKDPYVLKLCLNFDAKLQAFQSGAEVRPCTEKEILKHLADFGISHRLAQSGRIKGMSGGQKCRLVLASAVWNKPHLIALDEPTNYLDNETLNALTGALQRFKGAILVITHHAQFSNDVTNEKWMVDHGSVTVTQTAKEARLARNNSQDSLARSDSQESMSQSESMNSLSAALSSQSLSKDE
ncbi:P-loop containing nucleoside triphosphate hydrolase protein [Baffinella frigidus]|nr:P-loop containing nucleoside triphosphate hydrolase protein [Cryptophyta sp. CCMP2293]